MAQNAKMAFLGFGTLSQTTQNFLEEVAKGFGGFEVAGCFDDLRKAAAAITEVVDRKVVTVPNTILYVHESVDPANVAAAMNLVNVGVGVQAGWISWDEYFDGDKDAAANWLGHNKFPEKVDPLDLLLFGKDGAAAPSDPLDALLAAAPAAAAPEPAAPPAAEPAAPVPAEPAPAPAVTEDAPIAAAAEETPAAASRYSLPSATAPAPRNPLIPGGGATAAKQGEDAAFLAPGPELDAASGPTQARTNESLPTQDLAPREAVVEFRLPAAVALPTVALPAADTTPGPAPVTTQWDSLISAEPTAIKDAAPFPDRLKTATKGVGVFWTGSAGGSGKTTLSWTSANTLAAAYRAAGKDTPVYLVETDFGNPKFENRMPMGASNTAMAYVKYLNWLQENEGVAETSYVNKVEAKAIEEATWVDPTTGLRVIAAPYDTRTSTSAKIQEAILKLSRKLLSEDCVVFFDSGTVGRVDDKMLDCELAHLSTHVLIATRAGERDDSGKWVHAQVDDMRRMAMTMSSSTAKGGWGLDRSKIQAFFNKTDYDSYEERRFSADPIKVCGYQPYAAPLEGKWIGDIQNDESVDRAVAQLGRALYEVTSIPELQTFSEAPEPELASAEPAKKPSRSLFGRKKG